MKRWRRYIWPVVWGIWSALMIAQIVLAFFFNIPGIQGLRYFGWAVLALSAVFGWMPIFAFRKKGGVAKGKSYVHTTVLVDSGIYTVVRHPQFLAMALINLALMLIAQHWLIVIIGAVSMVLLYLMAIKAEQYLIGKFGDDYKRYMQRVPRMNVFAGLTRLAWCRERE
jgi:protein-S-isoprenylcysteine O-methyltransferase Ste14